MSYLPGHGNRVPNRYRDSAYVYTKNADGGYTIHTSFRVTHLDMSRFKNIRKHRVRSSDTLDSIALEYYGVPELWSVIADANSSKILYPLDITDMLGEVIVIPPLSYVSTL